MAQTKTLELQIFHFTVFIVKKVLEIPSTHVAFPLQYKHKEEGNLCPALRDILN